MQLIQQRDCAEGEITGTACSKHNGKLQYKICTAKKCHAGPGIFICQGRSTALGKITAHGNNNIIRSCLAACFFYMIMMTVVKRIVFGNDCCCSHENLLYYLELRSECLYSIAFLWCCGNRAGRPVI